jgi:ABC-type transport system involved in multi-copper enzyme maturation permease subunit
MILLGVSPIFSQEYSSGIDSLLLTSKNGKNKLTTSKVIACIIYCAAVCLFFNGTNFLINFVKSGVMGSGSPIQSINKYLDSPFAFTLLQYFFVEIAVMIFAAVCFGLLVLFISSVSKSSLIPFFTCGLIIAVPAAYRVMNLNIEGTVGHVLDCIVNFSYSELMRVSSLFKSFKAFNLFGYPILSCFVIPFVFLLITVAVVFFIFKTYKNHQVY